MGRSNPRCDYSVPYGLIISTRREVLFIAIYHCTIKIIKRSEGRSAVAVAAYRSGQKLTNEWDGQTHDNTRKGGVVHTEILLPAHAPPAFQERSTFWNSVEAIEKSGKTQLAREIEIALPVELDRAAQLVLVRAYVKDNFVSAGMCADFALHDKRTSPVRGGQRCSMTCKTEKWHSRSYAVSRKQLYIVLWATL